MRDERCARRECRVKFFSAHGMEKKRRAYLALVSKLCSRTFLNRPDWRAFDIDHDANR